MIKTITNLSSSILDLSAVKDVSGNAVTLRPAGGPGCSRDLPEASWRHEAVDRVIEMKWATFGTAAPAPAAPAPKAEIPKVAIEASSTEIKKSVEGIDPEAKPEVPADEAVAETPAVVAEEPAVVETPAVVEEPVVAETPAEEPANASSRNRRR